MLSFVSEILVVFLLVSFLEIKYNLIKYICFILIQQGCLCLLVFLDLAH